MYRARTDYRDRAETPGFPTPVVYFVAEEVDRTMTTSRGSRGGEGPRGDDNELQATIRMLEEEVTILRRRLQDAPRRVRVLEERLLESKEQLAQARSQNEKLATVLEETREQLAVLREEVEKLTAPPNPFGTVLQVNATSKSGGTPRECSSRLRPPTSWRVSRSGKRVTW